VACCRYTETETVAFVELSTRILTGKPFRDAGRTLFIHGSSAPETPLGTEVNVASRVGRGGSVLVTAGVSVKVAVGGGGVAVGMAAWVSATTVRAATMTVFCMSTGLSVGVACMLPPAPQALMSSVIRSTRVRIEKYFMSASPYRFNLSRILCLLWIQYARFPSKTITAFPNTITLLSRNSTVIVPVRCDD